MKASNLDKAVSLLKQNESCQKTVDSLKNARKDAFYLDHKSLSTICLPESIAVKLTNDLIARYEKLILKNRTELRMMGVNPDA